MKFQNIMWQTRGSFDGEEFLLLLGN